MEVWSSLGTVNKWLEIEAVDIFLSAQRCRVKGRGSWDDMSGN